MYDLVADPAELSNIYYMDPEQAQMLLNHFKDWNVGARLDQVNTEDLKALGYFR